MSLSGFVEKNLYIRKDEVKKVSLFFIFFAILMVGVEMGRGVSLSLFLTNVGIKKLPVMLMISSVFNTGAVLAYMGLSANRDNKTLFNIVLATGLALVLASRILFLSQKNLASYIAFIGGEFFFNAINLHFAVYLAQFFNTRQAKRVLPVIFSGSRVGGILGGIFLSFLPRYIGSVNILIIWILTIISAFACLFFINTRFTPEIFDYDQHKKKSDKFFKYIVNSIKYMKGSTLLKALAGGVFLLGFLSLVMKYLYSGIFVETFPNTDQLTSFFGIYTIISNILGFIVQLTLSNRIIDSLGLGAANLLYSIAFVSGFTLLTFNYGFLAGLWSRFTDEQLEAAIREPVEGLFYNAIPDHERARARALSSGLIKPLSEISGSAFLQLTRNFLVPVHIAGTGLFFSIIYLLTSLLQNKGYVDSLMKMVKDKTLNLEDLENLRWEKASSKDLDTLYKLATNRESSARESATTLLLHLDEDIDFDILKQGFWLWSGDIQNDFLINYFERAEKADNQFLLNILQNGTDRIKTLIVNYYARIDNKEIAGLLEEHLDNFENLMFQNSVIKYFCATGAKKTEEIEKIIDRRLLLEDNKTIKWNLHLIKELSGEKYLNYAKKMSYHKNRNLAINAINTLAEIYNPAREEEDKVFSMVNELINRQGYHEKRAAAEILSKIKNEKSRDTLLKLLDTHSLPLKKYLVEILASNYPGHFDPYLEILKSKSSSLDLKENIVALLKKIKNSKIETQLKDTLRALVSEYFELILEENYLLENNYKKVLMVEINSRKRNHIRLVILELLELLLNKKVVTSIEKALVTRNPRLISNAMELFENLWESKQAKDLVTLFYPESLEEELKIARKISDKNVTIQTFLDKYLHNNSSRWDLCAAIQLVGDIDQVSLREDSRKELLTYSKHKDPLVRELVKKILKIDLNKRRQEKLFTNLEKIIILKNAPIFKSLKMEELRLVAEITTERLYEEDEMIIEQGDLGDTMFIIATGKVEVYVENNNNHKTTLTYLSSPEFFGEMSLLDEEERSASVKASEETQLLCLQREHFLNLLYEKPEISLEIIKVLSGRIRKLDEVARENVSSKKCLTSKAE